MPELRLLVDIAERSCNSADQFLDLIRLAINIENLKVNVIFQALSTASTHHGSAAGNDLLPISKVLSLPDIPRPVDHSVMKPKVRVSGRSVEILRSSQHFRVYNMCDREEEEEGKNRKRRRTTAGISRDGEVTRRVHTSLALHRVLERTDSLAAGDERSDLSGCRIALRQVAADIALDAAGVVAVAV